MTETKLTKIIVGSDFNELSTVALRFAAGIASRSGAALTVVYADTFEPPAEFTKTQVHDVVASIERSKKRTLEELELHASRHVPHGVKWSAVVADALPATAISDLADKEQADFIVLGTHGRGGLQRLMIGSVAEAVMREARVPVLTVRTTATIGSVRRILCPVNSGQLSSLAVEQAAHIARALDATLTLMHFAARGETRCDIESLVPAGVRSEVVHRQIAHDDPAAEILAVEDSGAFDLIVIGAEHRRVRDVTLFGTTTSAVTRHARTPVLTVTGKAARPQASISHGVETHAV